jgi:hypothetical protein
MRKPCGLIMSALILPTATIAAAVLLCWLRLAARGTTMLYAWGWACVAAAGIAGVEFAIALPEELALTSDAYKPARYLAAILLFCPLMSVLGSKRPHEQAWQWIVLSLWGILALPALEWLALRRAPALEISGVRGWFLLLLVGMAAIHWLGTRLTVAGALLAAAQSCALWEWLPLGGTPVEPWISHTLLLAALAAGTRALRSPSPAKMLSGGADVSQTCETVGYDRSDVPVRFSNTESESTIARDRVWRDFRDRFGTLWAFRFMERVNSAAALANWTVRLEWNGFQTPRRVGNGEESVAASTENDPETGVNQVLWNLLRRFVSPDWCQARGWKPPE